MCSDLKIVVCPFVLFRLAIMLSVLLRFMDSDYPFGIFKLFLHVAPLGYIFLISGQPVFALTPYRCMPSREAANTDLITHDLTQPGIEPTIYFTQDDHINYNTITR
jgi:hypothetical protein